MIRGIAIAKYFRASPIMSSLELSNVFEGLNKNPFILSPALNTILCHRNIFYIALLFLLLFYNHGLKSKGTRVCQGASARSSI